jgi:hypothetical protein
MSINTTNNSVPGMMYPTQIGMLAGNPRDSAIAQNNAANQKLLSLQKVGGRRKRYYRRGGATAPTNNIPVAQFNMQYTSQGGPGQNPNQIIQQNAVTGTQGAANSVYDKYATQMGGYYNMNTNQYQWGCYSGGKKSQRTTRAKINKKTKYAKHKRSTRHSLKKRTRRAR